jgi:hypothetical protein
MSAVVGILNKQAIAIAADSAVTVNGKIFNRALKIFTLSKYRPVGVMIYSSGSFMNTPWETIIKIYRSELKEGAFPTVKEYLDNFISFLHTKSFFVDEGSQKEYIQLIFYSAFDGIIKQADSQANTTIPIDQRIESVCDSLIGGWITTNTTCNEFSDYTIDAFNQYLSTEFDEAVLDVFTNNNINLSAAIIEKLRRLVYGVIIKQEKFTYYTGLVFVGFGENEIFPSLQAINIHFALQNRLKYYHTNETHISHQMGSSIQPFAQTEAMNTILVGIAPELENKYIETFRQYSAKYNQRLIDIIQPTDPALAAAIQGIDLEQQVQEYAQKLQETKNVHYIRPLMDAVANLSKEDLAEMAESLIYLTYLQKRITFAPEDVGGAVDVAVISKGDGFIWIKRKHYFKPELNQFFFNNYFK